jgi:hypothetical protein
MANTWTAYFQGISFGASKNMASILNGGTRVLRIRRIGFINAQTAAVTGVACYGDIRTYRGTASLAGSTAVTPVAHDSSNSALSSVTIGHSGTPGGTASTLRRYFWSSDEAKLSTAQNNELEAFPALNVMWDSGYGDANVQPLVLRQNEMLTIYNNSGAAGLVDIWIEFTDEAS